MSSAAAASSPISHDLVDLVDAVHVAIRVITTAPSDPMAICDAFDRIIEIATMDTLHPAIATAIAAHADRAPMIAEAFAAAANAHAAKKAAITAALLEEAVASMNADSFESTLLEAIATIRAVGEMSEGASHVAHAAAAAAFSCEAGEGSGSESSGSVAGPAAALADVKRSPVKGEALHAAIVAEDEATCLALLAAGADPMICNDRDNTCMVSAIIHELPKVAEAILALSDVQFIDEDLHGSLHWVPLANASWRGYREVVKALLSKGAFPSICGMNESPLWFACHHAHPDIALLLIAAGADVKKGDIDSACRPIDCINTSKNGMKLVYDILVKLGANQ